MNPEYSNNFESTEYTDKIFSSIGRLLYVANIFESYCKVIYTKIKFTDNPELLIDSTKFKKFIKEVQIITLNNAINKTFNDNSIIKKTLNEARNSRNIIAHELTKDLNNIFEDINREKHLENEITDLANKIVEGEILCIEILTKIFKEQNIKINKHKRIEWILTG